MGRVRGKFVLLEKKTASATTITNISHTIKPGYRRSSFALPAWCRRRYCVPDEYYVRMPFLLLHFALSLPVARSSWLRLHFLETCDDCMCGDMSQRTRQPRMWNWVLSWRADWGWWSLETMCRALAGYGKLTAPDLFTYCSRCSRRETTEKVESKSGEMIAETIYTFNPREGCGYLGM